MRFMKTPNNEIEKHKVVDPQERDTQALQVVQGALITPPSRGAGGSSAPNESVDLVRNNTSSDTFSRRFAPRLLETMQKMIAAACGRK
ncbi:UNVERIFIED_CONTAM: hypothetical protein Sradi_1508800 [Sesamum radiatum]|uniref:Uncharacterized protein n=1 Tax=Sesamum radiatum TaxID=300843 RepID=A0AAW2UBB2_SESRA